MNQNKTTATNWHDFKGLRDKEEYDVEMHQPLIREDGALVLSFTSDEATITITLSELDARRVSSFYKIRVG